MTSFIIPSYNSYKTIEQTLKSILEQTDSAQIKEIILVDSSTDEKTREIIKNFRCEKLTTILLNQKTSPAVGRNIGAKIATGDFLCFIDSDVTLASDWLSIISKAYEEGKKAGSGSVAVPEAQSHNLLVLAQYYLQSNESIPTGKTRPVTMVPGCNMYVDRELFVQVSGFPEIRASEDVLLSLNLGKLTQLWMVPQAVCFHTFREDWQGYLKNQLMLGKYIIIYRRQISSKWFYQGLCPLILLPAFLIIKATRIKLRIYKAGWSHYKRFVISSPWFIVGLLYWAIGFAQGVFYKEGE